jgi:hypothetical protein
MLFRISAALFVIFILTTGTTSAQEASVAGTIVDESRAVLPGVTVTATSLGTGGQHSAVTDSRGEYRLRALPPGRYRIQAELAGFATVVVSNLELLVGQNATVPFELRVAALEESLTVTSDAPLVDLRSSAVAGNVDRRQMEDLPIDGRNWMQLTLFVKGITTNTVNNQPGVSNDREFQLSLDGQEVNNRRCCSGGFGNAKFSREAIAEYQVVTNMFDVTQGRSAGILVQAITKSGTNNFDGSLYGYFRDDSFNAADPFTKEVLPFSNQQTGGTLGGPIVANKTHFFASYEYEREPNTVVINPSAFSSGRVLAFPTKFTVQNVMGRVDQNLANGHLMVRGMFYERSNPADALSSNGYPNRGRQSVQQVVSATATWSRALSDTIMQEIKGGYSRFHYGFALMAGNPATPEYIFPGLTIGPRFNDPNPAYSPAYNVIYNLNWQKGRHDLKVGGEYRDGVDRQFYPGRSRGQMFFRARPADMERRFPLEAWNDPTQWDLTGIDQLALRFDIAYSNDFTNRLRRPTYALWIGDTWRLADNLRLNLGARYDLGWGDLAPAGLRETDVIIDNGLFVENVGIKNNIRDINNIQPRVGFTWDPKGSGDFVIRGGTGLFYAPIDTQGVVNMLKRNGQREIEVSWVNDGQPGWVLDPTRGVTADDVLSGRVALDRPIAIAVLEHDFELPYAWQTVLGFQKQINSVTGFDADLVYKRGYREEIGTRDPNLFYDPETGFPKDPNLFGRPNPAYGSIALYTSHGKSESLTLPMSFTRRYQNRFQATVTYTLMFYKNDLISPPNVFDWNSGWGRANDFQRHTFRVNGIWNLPADITLAGAYRYGSGNYSTLNSGVDPLGIGGGGRIRRDLTIIPRNTFKGDSHQSLDFRIAKAIPLGGDVRVDLMAEVFNLYNHARYSYNVLENSATFGQARASAGNPRTGQLAFRLRW